MLVQKPHLPNLIYGNQPFELSEKEIAQLINKFKKSASIAMLAGFDGIHIHGGNGYLISQFSSPITNRRKDRWGGTSDNRNRFLEIYKAIKKRLVQINLFQQELASRMFNQMDYQKMKE